MSIRRLPPEISGKIAAGEVIERPASVVRELLDNALDAGARHVDVAVEQGGKALIDVTDDGCGIPPDEVAVAVERHSTSKLTTVDDLARIQTLGFRGEALASIAAVAELRLRSVTGEGRPGREVLARDERLIEDRPVGGARGTRATVRELFRSIPARLEFLKAERTELGHIIAAVTRAALGHPHVAFTLHDGTRERLRTPGDGELRNALLADLRRIAFVDELDRNSRPARRSESTASSPSPTCSDPRGPTSRSTSTAVGSATGSSQPLSARPTAASCPPVAFPWWC